MLNLTRSREGEKNDQPFTKARYPLTPWISALVKCCLELRLTSWSVESWSKKVFIGANSRHAEPFLYRSDVELNLLQLHGYSRLDIISELFDLFIDLRDCLGICYH